MINVNEIKIKEDGVIYLKKITFKDNNGNLREVIVDSANSFINVLDLLNLLKIELENADFSYKKVMEIE